LGGGLLGGGLSGGGLSEGGLLGGGDRGGGGLFSTGLGGGGLLGGGLLGGGSWEGGSGGGGLGGEGEGGGGLLGGGLLGGGLLGGGEGGGLLGEEREGEGKGKAGGDGGGDKTSGGEGTSHSESRPLSMLVAEVFCVMRFTLHPARQWHLPLLVPAVHQQQVQARRRDTTDLSGSTPLSQQSATPRMQGVPPNLQSWQLRNVPAQQLMWSCKLPCCTLHQLCCTRPAQHFAAKNCAVLYPATVLYSMVAHCAGLHLGTVYCTAVLGRYTLEPHLRHSTRSAQRWGRMEDRLRQAEMQSRVAGKVPR